MRTIWELLLSFLQVGFFSIGGGYATIPLIKQYVVDDSGWLTMQEFTDIITISQMTPGPLAVNTSTFVGVRLAGLPGAVVATLGCVLSGLVISLALYRFFSRHGENRLVARSLTALRSASVGLIAAAAATILAIAFFGGTGELVGEVSLAAVAIFSGCLLVLRRYKTNPILVMVGAGAAGLLLFG